MKKIIINLIVTSFIICLIGIGHSINGNDVTADEIKSLERKLEYLKQKKILDAQLQKIQNTIKKLNDDYSDVQKPPLTKEGAKTVKKESAKTVTSEWILKSLVKSNGGVALKGCCGDNQTFKFTKYDGKFYTANESNGTSSQVKLGSDNTISMEDFPPGWVINGEWSFSGKKGSECKILHEENTFTMWWKC